MMFFGIYTLSMNEKFELTLPNALHETMGGSAFLTRGFDRNLFLLSQEAFHTISSHVRSTSISDPMSRLLRRLFLGGAARVSLNDQGRMEIPGDLCTFAGLEREVTLVGQGDYLELWSTPGWDKQMESLNEPEANTQRFEKFNLPLD
jgi:MraZ protein